MARVLTSPGGDHVEVLDDHQLARRLGLDLDDAVARRSLSQMVSWTGTRPPVFHSLWTHGPYESASGWVTRALAADADLTVTQATPVLNGPLAKVCLERHVVGRRTYSIKLVAIPERWIAHLSAVSGDTAKTAPSDDPGGVDEDATGPALSKPPQESAGPPGPDWERGFRVLVDADQQIDVDQAVAVRNELVHGPAVELDVAGAVALSLLTQVIEIVTAGHGDAHELGRMTREVADLAERLGGQVADSQKLRRQIRDVGDELLAVKQERDGLRSRLRAAEHNLKVATSGDVQRVIDAEVRKRLDTLMRQVPNDVRARA